MSWTEFLSQDFGPLPVWFWLAWTAVLVGLQ